MPSINNLVATTETEALNQMLSAIGEAPVADIDTATGADIDIAKGILRSVAKDVLLEGWRFNSEFGFEIAPAATQAWSGSDGTSATLNVFEVPANLAKFRVTPTSQQLSEGIDLVERPSATYASGATIIFYDRAKNRDGLDAARFPQLFIDPVWYFDFDKCPESIRKLITVMAARRFAGDATNSDTLVRFTVQDEVDARRQARRDHGTKDRCNMLNEISVGAALGGRLYRGYGRLDYRNSPRKV